MKIAVISYSLTGNNMALAQSVAQEIEAEHISIEEPVRRTMASILLDMILNRTPKVMSDPHLLQKHDLVLFVGPVWMGMAASPLRAYFKHLKINPRKYAFISISGGADGENPKLADDLRKRTGIQPATIIDLHIAALLPAAPKPTRKVTSAYRLNVKDVNKLTEEAMKSLRNVIVR